MKGSVLTTEPPGEKQIAAEMHHKARRIFSDLLSLSIIAPPVFVKLAFDLTGDASRRKAIPVSGDSRRILEKASVSLRADTVLGRTGSLRQVDHATDATAFAAC
jgi:hypothetical protein